MTNHLGKKRKMFQVFCVCFDFCKFVIARKLKTNFSGAVVPDTWGYLTVAFYFFFDGQTAFFFCPHLFTTEKLVYISQQDEPIRLQQRPFSAPAGGRELRSCRCVGTARAGGAALWGRSGAAEALRTRSPARLRCSGGAVALGYKTRVGGGCF